MDSLEDISKKLNASHSIKKVVATMKALAVTNIKIFEKMINSLFQYKNNIELGIQAIVSKDLNIIDELRDNKDIKKETKNIIILYGSNQGLCGKFNDKILDFFIDDLKNQGFKSKNSQNFLIVIGDRLKALVESEKIEVGMSLPMPNFAEDVVDTIHILLNQIEQFKDEFNFKQILLYYIDHSDSTSNLIKKQLLPIDKQFLQDISTKVWPTNNIPFWRVETKDIFLNFIKQYIFISLYYSLAISIISEQKYRLMSLQNSENNISDLIKEMTLEFNQRKQSLITSEMLDIISGCNMLENE